MLLKRIQRSKKDFSNGWKCIVQLTAEVHREKDKVIVKTIEQSPMGKYIRERVCKDVTEAYFIAEEHTA